MDFDSKDKETINQAKKELFLNVDERYIFRYKYIMIGNLFNETIKNSDELELKAYKEYDNQRIKRYNNYNGVTLFPNDKHKDFIILINNKMNNNHNYLHTFIHELTHIIDYTMYMQDHNFKTGTELFNNINYHYIYFWTEYHARYEGYKYYINYLISSKEEQLYNSIHFDFPTQMNWLKDKIYDKQLSFERKLVEVCYQYGRFKYYKEIGFNAIEDANFIEKDLLNVFGVYIVILYKIFINTINYSDFNQEYSKIEFCINHMSHDFYKLQNK